MSAVPDAEIEFLTSEPEPLWTFAYVSKPVVRFDEAELRGLHLAAETWNVRHGMTGRLVVVERDERVASFIQVVEGPLGAAEVCAARIFADPRHGDISVIQSCRIDARRFGSWTMRYDTEPETALSGEVAAALWRATDRADSMAPRT